MKMRTVNMMKIAGKLEFTRALSPSKTAPVEEDSYKRSLESTILEDETYENEDSEHDEGDMSAVTLSPGHSSHK